MRFLLRADAGLHRGSGHVMRCLTLAEELLARGHQVELLGSIHGIPWLEQRLDRAGIVVRPCATDELDASRIGDSYDRVVVDSYWIQPDAIAAVDAQVPVLMMVDNDTRGIQASWYLDQNLGADERSWPAATRGRILAGSDYALVRDDIIAGRRPDGWRIPGRESRVVAFMGGTDPSHVMTDVARSVAASLPDLDFLAVTTAPQVDAVVGALSGMPRARVSPPTDDLPQLLADSDAVVSAAGTSAWDVCTMGRPAVLVGVVANQSESLVRAVERSVALGVDATTQGASAVGGLLAQLLDDQGLRRRLVERAVSTFDGRGKERVADALERDPG